MKATTENKIHGSTRFINHLLYVIKTSQTREELNTNVRALFNVFVDSDAFIYGFGGSHMWVANKEGGERIIFVEL